MKQIDSNLVRLEVKMNIKEIKDRNSLLISQLLEIWEDSVKATHSFLSNDENKKEMQNQMNINWESTNYLNTSRNY